MKTGQPWISHDKNACCADILSLSGLQDGGDNFPVAKHLRSSDGQAFAESPELAHPLQIVCAVTSTQWG
jgi:hypothetical protein